MSKNNKPGGGGKGGRGLDRISKTIVRFCILIPSGGYTRVCFSLLLNIYWYYLIITIISFCVFVCVCAQSCPTLGDHRDCSLPGSFDHGIFQARILEWVAISFSRGSSSSRDWTRVSCISCIGKQILYQGATWEALIILYNIIQISIITDCVSCVILYMSFMTKLSL